jgi:hypothetical protein
MGAIRQTEIDRPWRNHGRSMTVTRRSALSFLSAAALCAAPSIGLVAASDVRRLKFEHLHTGERLDVAY